MPATSDLLDAWADLVHGSACLGCAMPGRPWCRSCATMLRRGIPPTTTLEAGIPGMALGYAGDYDGWLRALILAHKERSAWSLAAPLGLLLGEVVRSVIRPATSLDDAAPVAVLVPVPSRRAAVRARGHDPTLRMTRAAASSLRASGVDACALRLLRVRLPVRDSVGLSAGERSRNLVDVFATSTSARRALDRLPAARQIVICDDVTTTGATLREAGAALELAGLRAFAAATVARVAG